MPSPLPPPPALSSDRSKMQRRTEGRMNHHHWTLYNRCHPIFVIALIFINVAPSTFALKDRQQWLCSSDLCEPDNVLQSKTKNAIRFRSQHDCRLSCGPYGAIWPMPTINCSIDHGRVVFDPWQMRFHSVAIDTDTTQLIDDMKRNFVANILKECLRNCSAVDSSNVLVKAHVTTNNYNLNWETDESYTLTIFTREMGTIVRLQAATVYGIRHAFETLTNLITGNTDNGLLLVKSAYISDRPLFAHRGLLLDTARNYIPVSGIRRTLDGMAASKLNVFHWHIVDSQSFPLEITRVPDMQLFGAYSSQDTYNRSDVENIIKYARLRGIRVLIEIDGPAHVGNGWQWGPWAQLGNLTVCTNQQPWRSYCMQPPCGQLNPFNDHMYATMQDIYADLNEVLAPEETIHMGGDEVFIPCWNRTVEITSEMKRRGYRRDKAGFLALWAEFHARNLRQWDELDSVRSAATNTEPKSVIVWSSHLTDPSRITHYLPKERFIIQTWTSTNSTLNSNLLQLGYRIIVSTKDAWYLDHGFWGRTQYHMWRSVYGNALPVHTRTLGGEVCMWTEYVDNNSLDSRIWPRAGAAAERLWANPAESSTVAEPRFYRYRARLLSRGIQADALAPKWCVINEGKCK